MRYPNAGRRLGRLIITTCRQGTTPNLVDQAGTVDAEGNSYRSVAIVRPWRRNRHGEYSAQRALVIGWRR